MITGSERCQPSTGNPTAAAVNAGVAAGAWAAVGCTVNGCAPPARCNTITLQCESTPCTSDRDCAAGFSCESERGVCY